MSVELVAFLRARIDEDERAAWLAMGRRWAITGSRVVDAQADRAVRDVVAGWSPALIAEVPAVEGNRKHIARHDPTRVLADVEAKRQIISEYLAEGHNPTGEMRDYGYEAGLERALELLALPFEDHPDYRQEWKP